VKLLLDANVGRRVADALRQAGYDVERVAAGANSPSDEAILAYAFRKKRIVVTQDRDFGELAIRLGRSHSGIIRLKGIGVSGQAPACRQALLRYAEQLMAGSLVTVDRQKIRVRSGANNV